MQLAKLKKASIGRCFVPQFQHSIFLSNPCYFKVFGGIMSFTVKLFKVFLVAALISVFSVVSFADTIRLKDGSSIKGKILSFASGQFVIQIGSGDRVRQMRFFADEIESIVFDSDSSEISTTATVEPVRKEPGYSTTKDGDNTIITVGSASKTPNPQSNQVVISNPSTPPPSVIPAVTSTPATTTSSPKPIQIKVKVLADNTANGWSNAGWVVRKGQKIKITSDGRISLGNGRFAGPRGIATLPDENKLLSDKPTGSLIAVIGDDNNDFIFVGDGTEFIAERDGALFLGINEGVLDDNNGSFEVVVEIDPNIGG